MPFCVVSFNLSLLCAYFHYIYSNQLFAFFLGGFGAHKFYAGKTAQGFLYLIFFWTFIPGIIAFIEFILALAKDADSNGNICV